MPNKDLNLDITLDFDVPEQSPRESISISDKNNELNLDLSSDSDPSFEKAMNTLRERSEIKPKLNPELKTESNLNKSIKRGIGAVASSVTGADPLSKLTQAALPSSPDDLLGIITGATGGFGQMIAEETAKIAYDQEFDFPRGSLKGQIYGAAIGIPAIGANSVAKALNVSKLTPEMLLSGGGANQIRNLSILLEGAKTGVASSVGAFLSPAFGSDANGFSELSDRMKQGAFAGVLGSTIGTVAKGFQQFNLLHKTALLANKIERSIIDASKNVELESRLVEPMKKQLNTLKKYLGLLETKASQSAKQASSDISQSIEDVSSASNKVINKISRSSAPKMRYDAVKSFKGASKNYEDYSEMLFKSAGLGDETFTLNQFESKLPDLVDDLKQSGMLQKDIDDFVSSTRNKLFGSKTRIVRRTEDVFDEYGNQVIQKGKPVTKTTDTKETFFEGNEEVTFKELLSERKRIRSSAQHQKGQKMSSTSDDINDAILAKFIGNLMEDKVPGMSQLNSDYALVISDRMAAEKLFKIFGDPDLSATAEKALNRIGLKGLSDSDAKQAYDILRRLQRGRLTTINNESRELSKGIKTPVSKILAARNAAKNNSLGQLKNISQNSWTKATQDTQRQISSLEKEIESLSGRAVRKKSELQQQLSYLQNSRQLLNLGMAGDLARFAKLASAGVVQGIASLIVFRQLGLMDR